MDKKKTLTGIIILLGALLGGIWSAKAQDPSRLQFADRAYEYGPGNDSIKLFFNLYSPSGKSMPDVPVDRFSKFFTFYEDGNQIENFTIRKLNAGVRIPRDYTFSVLLDQSIPESGKRDIMKAVRQFVDMAPDSTIYVSIYGNGVGNTRMVTKANFAEIEKYYLMPATGKKFYSGVYSKLAEFTPGGIDLNRVTSSEGAYMPNAEIARRAAQHPGKNILMVFAEGSARPDDEAGLDYLDVEDMQRDHVSTLPKVYGFYYIPDGEDSNIVTTLQLMANPQDSNHRPIPSLKGRAMASSSLSQVVASFQETYEESAYGYELDYLASEGRAYTGNVDYSAKWGNETIGNGVFTIGSAERPWPERKQTTTNIIFQVIMALVVSLLTFAFYFAVIRIVVPWVRSLTFKKKYYTKYVPEANVSRRICHYCKQDLQPGQTIVTKCSHWMHKHCWEQNEYRCAEYGQNCKDGIQDHIDWKEMFKMRSLRDSSQTLAGVLAGLVSWIIYEICGRGAFFSDFASWITGIVYHGDDAHALMVGDCVARTCAFLMIGMLLGFFISLVFRYKDDVKQKNWKGWLKIIGLSIFTAAVGFLAFAIGAWIFCLIVKAMGKTYIPWFASLPAYVLFSICVSLALTVGSSIPVKSALLGGCVSAVIGFLVLYFTKFTSAGYEWINMLLDFIIFGGGLGASLITVRMLAEKYFLVIQNGVKAGQRIPIHKWMNATGGGNKVSIGMTGECEIQMYWEKSNKVAKEHAKLYINHERNLPVIKPLAMGVLYNNRADLPVNRESVLSNGDTFKIGETIFKYEEL